jgi:hypothetical protein
MAVTQTTLPAPALVLPTGLAGDIEHETGVSVAFFGAGGRPLREAGVRPAPESDTATDDTPAARLAEDLGFSVARRLTRMYLGEKMNPGEVGLTYGIAGFEFG